MKLGHVIQQVEQRRSPHKYFVTLRNLIFLSGQIRRQSPKFSTLAKPETKHFKALDKSQVGPMLRKLNESNVHPVTRAALRLMMFTGLRDASIRGAQWKEVDLSAAIWTVPAARMRSSREHQVPLPGQAVDTLEQLKAHTYKGKNSFVFASVASKYGTIAENSLRIALHRLGFEVTAHGMRTLITNVLNESGFNADAIERQLDHGEQNQVRAAYLSSNFMEQRVAMMQWFIEWCDAQMHEKRPPKFPGAVS